MSSGLSRAFERAIPSANDCFAPDEDGIHIKGSARSIDGVHIRDTIEQVAEQHPELVSHFGGHAAAAGLTIRKENFEAFKTVFNDCVATMDESIFQATLWTDGELPVSALQLDTLNWIEQLGPWGQNFHCLNLRDILKLSISVGSKRHT